MITNFSKKMKKKIVIIILVLILTILAGGFWYLKNQDQDQEVDAVENSLIVASEKIDNYEIESLDISDWETYRNENLGFEVKYPEEFSVKLDNSFVFLSKDCPLLKKEDLEIQMKCELEREIVFSTTSVGMEDFIKNYENDFNEGVPLTRIKSQKNYTLDGVPGKILEGTAAEGSGGNDYIFVTKNNMNYIVSYNQYSDINSKIVSTFKFIK